jgi:hypothetical protein
VISTRSGYRSKRASSGDHVQITVAEPAGQGRKRFGFELQVFDEGSAREFIRTHLGSRYEKAFDKCYHPSMKSDYFRYSYIFVEGGFYVDADDVYHGTTIDHLFTDGRLKLQPFCYDIATAQMVPPSVFVNPGANQLSWIFYFNTTPLIAVRNHPIIERALLNATTTLEQESKSGLPEVQATTGPGNLTRSVFEVVTNGSRPEARGWGRGAALGLAAQLAELVMFPFELLQR